VTYIIFLRQNSKILIFELQNFSTFQNLFFLSIFDFISFYVHFLLFPKFYFIIYFKLFQSFLRLFYLLSQFKLLSKIFHKILFVKLQSFHEIFLLTYWSIQKRDATGLQSNDWRYVLCTSIPVSGEAAQINVLPPASQMTERVLPVTLFSRKFTILLSSLRYFKIVYHIKSFFSNFLNFLNFNF